MGDGELPLRFSKETELCAEFLKLIPEGWTAYPETGGFDIVLVRKSDGFQIGIEAKLRLSAKVIAQAAEHIGSWYSCESGPDCRAVLVPGYCGGELAQVCRLLGIEIMCLIVEEEWSYRKSDSNAGIGDGYLKKFYRLRPDLPRLEDEWRSGSEWFEFAPHQRLVLPDYVPDTGAGDKSPVQLTHWKIGAMKLAILLDKTGYLIRQDFKDIGVSISRWTGNGLLAWLKPGKIRGQWVGNRLPDFSKQHPVNYRQIKDDFDKWNPRKGEL